MQVESFRILCRGFVLILIIVIVTSPSKSKKKEPPESPFERNSQPITYSPQKHLLLERLPQTSTLKSSNLIKSTIYQSERILGRPCSSCLKRLQQGRSFGKVYMKEAVMTILSKKRIWYRINWNQDNQDRIQNRSKNNKMKKQLTIEPRAINTGKIRKRAQKLILKSINSRNSSKKQRNLKT